MGSRMEGRMWLSLLMEVGAFSGRSWEGIGKVTRPPRRIEWLLTSWRWFRERM